MSTMESSQTMNIESVNSMLGFLGNIFLNCFAGIIKLNIMILVQVAGVMMYIHESIIIVKDMYCPNKNININELWTELNSFLKTPSEYNHTRTKLIDLRWPIKQEKEEDSGYDSSEESGNQNSSEDVNDKDDEEMVVVEHSNSESSDSDTTAIMGSTDCQEKKAKKKHHGGVKHGKGKHARMRELKHSHEDEVVDVTEEEKAKREEAIPQVDLTQDDIEFEIQKKENEEFLTMASSVMKMTKHNKMVQESEKQRLEELKQNMDQYT